MHRKMWFVHAVSNDWAMVVASMNGCHSIVCAKCHVSTQNGTMSIWAFFIVQCSECECSTAAAKLECQLNFPLLCTTPCLHARIASFSLPLFMRSSLCVLTNPKPWLTLPANKIALRSCSSTQIQPLFLRFHTPKVIKSERMNEWRWHSF